VTQEAERLFDLTQGPLFRAALFHLGSQEHLLLLTMHHIVSDGWSIGLLLRELGILYQAYTTSQPSPLPELTLQYADFALWQRDWLTGPVLEEQHLYWQRQLAGAPACLALPLDHPRPGQ